MMERKVTNFLSAVFITLGLSATGCTKASLIGPNFLADAVDNKNSSGSTLLLSGSLTLASGDISTYVGTLGTAGYTYSDSSSYINSSSGVLTVPFNNMSPHADTVTVTDALGATKSLSVQIHSFQTQDTYYLNQYTLNTTDLLNLVVTADGSLFGLGIQNPGGTSSEGVIRKSTDHGATWTTVMDIAGYNPNGIATDSLGAMYVIGTSSGVPITRKSSDGGATWQVVDTGALTGVTGIDVDATTGDVFVVGSGGGGKAIRRSTDGGATWASVDTLGGNYYAVKAVGGVIYAAEGFPGLSVRVSTDSGTTWNPGAGINVGSSNLAGGSFASDTLGNVFLMAVVNEAWPSTLSHVMVWKSSDSGANWSSVYNDALNGVTLGSIAVDTSNNIYLGDQNGYSGFISTDHGVTWNALTLPSIHSVPYFAADPSGRVYLASYQPTAASTGWLIDVSTNQGLTWGQVDNFTDPTESAVANAIAMDSGHNLFAVGQSADASNVVHWIVRKSADSAATWTTVDDFSYSSGYDSKALSIAVDSLNNVYVVGQGKTNADWHWVVRASTDGGNTWNTVDDQTGSASASKVVIDSSDRIFVLGTISSGGVTSWVVRSSTNGGAAWAAVDTYDINNSASASNQPYAMAVDPVTGQIYVAGHAYDYSGGTQYSVLRTSTDHGTTWNGTTTLNGTAISVLQTDSLGGLYAISGTTAWTVQKSTDQGTTWSTLDNNFTFGGGTTAVAHSMGFDSNGYLYVAGNAMQSAAAASTWLIRRSKDGGASWSNLDGFYSSPAFASSALSVIPCLGGKMCAVGDILSASGEQWVTRIFAP